MSDSIMNKLVWNLTPGIISGVIVAMADIFSQSREFSLSLRFLLYLVYSIDLIIFLWIILKIYSLLNSLNRKGDKS